MYFLSIQLPDRDSGREVDVFGAEVVRSRTP